MALHRVFLEEDDYNIMACVQQTVTDVLRETRPLVLLPVAPETTSTTEGSS